MRLFITVAAVAAATIIPTAEQIRTPLGRVPAPKQVPGIGPSAEQPTAVDNHR